MSTDLRITSNKLFIDVLRSFIHFDLKEVFLFFRNYFKVNEMSSHCHFSHSFKNTCMYAVLATNFSFVDSQTKREIESDFIIITISSLA